HLDLEMRQALAMALQEYAGAVIMVSHDRHLLATVTDTFLLVADGRVREFDGDLDDYARWLSRGEGTAAPKAPAPAAAPAPDAPKPAPLKRDAAGRDAARRDSAEQRKTLAPMRARLVRVEKRMQELATQAGELDALLADPALYEPAARQRQLDLTTQRARVAQETAEVESEWLELSEELERAAG